MKKEIDSLTKVIILILSMTLLAFLILAFSKEQISMPENDKIIQTVIQNEKNLVLVQLNDLEVDKYKEEVKQMLHSNFSESYIEKIDATNENNGIFALSIECHN